MRARGRARLAIVIVVIVLAVAIGGAAFVLGRGGDRTALDEARALVSSDDGFDTGLHAGETLARVAQHLERTVKECRRDERGVSCQALSAALGYAQVLASWVLECTDPGRLEARTRMAAYLDTVERVASDAVRVPGPPRLPACRA